MLLVTVAMIASLLFVAAAGLWLHSRLFTRLIEKRYPNTGRLIDLGHLKLNVLHVAAGPNPDLPPIVFIHGASGNLRDQAGAFLEPLRGRAELLFIDRPGHGYSERGGPQNATPDGQAKALADAMDRLGIAQAIIVGHSFGGAIAASFALYHPEKTRGLLFLAPATHPWPTGVDWHYRLAVRPVLGWLFSHLIVPLAGRLRLDSATRGVFAPDPRPADYVATTAPHLVLRPRTFRHNAEDVTQLHAYVTATAPLYPAIKAPTVVISGTEDRIVLADIHSRGLARDIAGAELIWLDGMGHKPDYAANALAVTALERLARR
ncbi:alpha/beta fold hydrolase [Allorhizobium undicola]|uniref:alpha/beta fold hydrolase n=1 Tax=Allorhizobium undicola TaxID=78527 RepID=UPI003D32B884